MAVDPLAKVRPGQPLKIPAAAYNAFVDAAKATRGVRADALVSPTRENLPGGAGGVVPIKNNSAAAIERYGVLGISGPLFDPSEALESFKRRVALTGVTPDEDLHLGRFAVAMEPIATGRLGMACVCGVCVAKVEFPPDDGRERPFADIGDGVTANLKAADRGAATILWRELAPMGGVKWAVVRLGGLVPTRVFPVSLAVVGVVYGDASTPTAHTYDVFDAASGAQLAAAVDPTAAPHKCKRPSIGRYASADFGLAFWDETDGLVITWINEVPELEPCS